MNQPPLDVRRLVAYGVAVVRECISMNTSEPNPKWLLVLIISSFHINDLFICPTMQRIARSDGPRDVIRETHLACPLDDISTAWHRRSNSPPFFSHSWTRPVSSHLIIQRSGRSRIARVIIRFRITGSTASVNDNDSSYCNLCVVDDLMTRSSFF